MEIGVVSLVLEAASQAAVLIGEVGKRRKQASSDTLLATLQKLDLEIFKEDTTALSLAAHMKGTVFAAEVHPALKTVEYRSLLTELLLTVLVDNEDEKQQLVLASMDAFWTRTLESHATLPDIQCFSESLSSCLVTTCQTLADELRQNNPSALVALQNVSLLKRVDTTLGNIDEHLKLISAGVSPETVATRRKWTETYKGLCAKIHGYIVPPDFETNRKVPMDELYVIPSIADGGPSQYKGGPDLDFEEFVSAIDRTVLLGDPGGGKSTLSNYLAATVAKTTNDEIPFHITLREYAKVATDQSVLQYIEKQLSTLYQALPPAGFVEELLVSGRALVIFDGLDELIDATKRRSISSIVETFGVRYPLTRILVTSRRIGYDQARLDPEIFLVRVIGEFKQEDVANYVHKWFASQDEYEESTAEQLAESFVAQSEAVTDLRSNPLMLALMCIIFRGENFIPRNRPAVYEKCATLLFEKWDGHREIVVPLEARNYVDSALKYIAHWMLESEVADLGVNYERLVREISAYLAERAFETEMEAEKAAKEFVDYCKGRAWVFSDAGTTSDGTSLFTFTHRTFMEYFAAYHLTRIHETPERLARAVLPRIAKEEWDVVAQLAVQIMEKAADRGSERALRTMLEEARKRAVSGRSNVLQFVVRAAVIANVSPHFIQNLTIRVTKFFLDHIDIRSSGTGPANAWIDLVFISPRDPVIERTQSEVLAEVLANGTTAEKSAACRLIILALSISWSGFSGGSPDNRNLWQFFCGVAHKFSSDLSQIVHEEPVYLATLILAGIESPDAVKADATPHRSLAEAFFNSYDIDNAYFSPPSLALALSTLGSRPPRGADSEKDELALVLARILLARFAAERPLQRPDKVLPPYQIAFSPKVEVDHPAEIVEAAVVVSLAHYELLEPFIRKSFAELPDAPSKILPRLAYARYKQREVELSDIEDLGLSSGIAEFATSWSRNLVSVFTAIE
ncbi:hypothetical protein GCM10022377_27140 [Zhihengliuella alba]|uniref:NACHT domain-containing protein n=1 Tax=Zhihengliuella alba TaxID=547018 RepID=A0ABP7E4P4_9MICC